MQVRSTSGLFMGELDISPGANLTGAYLSKADLREANLIGADLGGAKLTWADLRNADLTGADLSGANFSRANLSGANFSRADLSGADLREARYSLFTVLQAKWEAVPPALCVEMMKWDASAHPDKDAFMKWKNGGGCPCPFKHTRVSRILQFRESHELYEPGEPTMTLWGLWEAIANAKGIKI